MVNLSTISKLLCRCALLGGVLVISSVHAAGDSWSVKRLMQELSEVRSANLKFVETRQSMYLSTDLVIKGNIKYRAPDYFEKVTLSPMVEKVVVDGDTLRVEKMSHAKKQDAVLETRHYSIESHPVLKATVGSIRYIMAGNAEMLDEYYDMVISGQCESWTLELTPKTAEISDYAHKIILSGNESSILKYVTIQTDGDESVMTLTYDTLNKGNNI